MKLVKMLNSKSVKELEEKLQDTTLFSKKEVNMQNLEKASYAISKKHNIKISLIFLPSPHLKTPHEEDRQYIFHMVTTLEKGAHALESFHVDSLYEGFIKCVLYMYHFVKRKEKRCKS